jgi:hypothetical protein
MAVRGLSPLGVHFLPCSLFDRCDRGANPEAGELWGYGTGHFRLQDEDWQLLKWFCQETHSRVKRLAFQPKTIRGRKFASTPSQMADR